MHATRLPSLTRQSLGPTKRTPYELLQSSDPSASETQSRNTICPQQAASEYRFGWMLASGYKDAKKTLGRDVRGGLWCFTAGLDLR